MTIDYALPAGLVKPPWDASHFQVVKNGARYYADTLPPCDLIPDPHTDPVPGFSSLKPSKPFRKSVTVGDRKYTVPLDWYRAGEYWMSLAGTDMLDIQNPPGKHAFYSAVHVQRDRDFARGHAIHQAAEDVLNGKMITNTNADAAPYIPHLAKWLEDNVTDVAAVEAVVFGDGYGGTGDAWLNVRGVSCYVDFKSRGVDSAHGIYEEEIAQGGAYTSARYCILPSDDRERAVRAPLPAATYGLVLSIRPDGTSEYWYALDGARDAFACMHEAYRATSESGKVARKAKVKDPTQQIAVPLVSKAASSSSQPEGGLDAHSPADTSDPKALLEELKAYDVEVTLQPVIDPLNGQQHIDLTVKLPGKTKRSYGWAATDKGKADVLTRAIADVRRALKIPIGYTPTVAATVAPAEGDPVADVDDIRTRYLALDPAARAWVDGKRSEALSAGVDFHLAGNYTQRRLGIMDGLCVLAAAEMDDDDAVRALVRFATTDDAMEWPTVPAGAAVGSMNAVQADTFANAARLLTGGLVGLEVGDGGAKLTGVGA